MKVQVVLGNLLNTLDFDIYLLKICRFGLPGKAFALNSEEKDKEVTFEPNEVCVFEVVDPSFRNSHNYAFECLHAVRLMQSLHRIIWNCGCGEYDKNAL